MTDTTENPARIRELNDEFRKTFEPGTGTVVMTRAVSQLPPETITEIVKGVKTFDAFTEDNDPNGEHDFGNFKLDDLTIWFKIDYYNRDMTAGSEDPSDPEQTMRVLTILFPEDY